MMKLEPWHTHYSIPTGAASLLDVGCNVGAGLEHAAKVGVERLYGIEINPEAVTSSVYPWRVIACMVHIHGVLGRQRDGMQTR